MNRTLLNSQNRNVITFAERPGVEFQISEKEVGRGASCIVYHAVGSDNTEHLLKEYYPKHLELVRDSFGHIVVSEDKKEPFEQGLVRFRVGCERQKTIRLSNEGLKNFTCNVQGYYVANGTEYIDMTCFNGQTYDYVQERSVYNLMLRMKTLAQVVGNYHKAGLLHLDIKPENIYVRPEGETIEDVMLFDFDSVTPMNEIVISKALSCTKTWAAPEQLLPEKRRSICPATDLFAIGEIIFFQLFGRHSASAERRSFVTKYDYDHSVPIFKDMNPKAFPLLDDLLRHTICGVVGKRYQSADELMAKLDEIIEIASPIKQQLLTTCPPAKKCFVGRKKELDEIHNALKNQKTLFLSGIGGIGKSELAKNYALKHKDDYDEIIFATYTGSIMLLINDDSAVHISNFGCSDDTNQFKYFRSKLEKLMDLCTDRTLFIIDNLNSLDFSDDENLQWTELLKLRCKFLFTTRLQISSYPSIQIGEIATQEDRLKLFSEWCEIEDEIQMDAAKKIIELVNGHTFTIELIAKQTYAGFSSPTEKLNALISNGIQESGSEIVEADKDLAVSQGQVIDHICMLFDIAALDDAKRHVLNNISLVSPGGLDAKLFANLCAWGDNISDAEEHMAEIVLDDSTLLTPERVKAEIMWLVKNGWIIRNGSVVCVHPVVTEAILAKTDSLDVCSPYLSGIIDCLDHWEKYPIQLKTQLLNCAQSLLSFFERSKCSSEDIVVVAKMIGQFYCKKQYMMTEALSAFRLSEKKFIACDSNNNELKLSIKNSIAVVHDYMADITDDNTKRTLAIAVYRECLAIYDSINADPIDVAVTWQNLACGYDNSGMYELAEEAFAQSIQIMNRVMQAQGHTERTVSETVTLYTNYAIHYKKIECHEDALTNLNTAFGYASLLGNKTEQIAKICHDIAAIILLMEGGDLNRALNHAKRSLEIRREILLSDSYYLAMSKYVLARCYVRTGLDKNIQQAKMLLEEAKPVFIKTLGADHKETIQLVRTLVSMK